MNLIRTVIVGSSILAATAWMAMAEDQGQGKGCEHRGHGQMFQGILEKLNLADDQKVIIKDITDKAKADAEEFMKAHADELKAAKESNDREKMREILAPMMEKRKATVEAIKAVLTDEQKQKFAELMPKHEGWHHEKAQQ